MKHDAQLSQIHALDAGITSAHKKTGQQVYLLGFDTRATGHAIVAVGNPDTATNTATYVPGFRTHLSGAGGDLDRTATLYADGIHVSETGDATAGR